MDRRSELAMESGEGCPQVAVEAEKRLGRYVSLLSLRAGAPFGKEGEKMEEGRYHTLLIEGNVLEISDIFEEISKGISRLLAPRLRRKKKVLVVGLGNPRMVVDALGSETVHALSSGEESGRYLAALIPSVYGVTGIESAAVVRGVVREIRPDVVIAVDTLATRRAERLCRAVQIGETGIVPGGGVGNRRESLSFASLGVPVLSLGVPLLAHAELCASLPAGLVLTPKEIDLYVPAFAKAIARGIEGAL